MPDGYILFVQCPADELASVAQLGFTFAAQQRYCECLQVGGLKSFDAFFEKTLLPDEVVVYPAGGVMTGRVLRTSSKGVAQVDVFDVTLVEAAVKGLTVVLGVEFGVGLCADVGEIVDVVFFEEVQQLVDGTGAVADGEDGHNKEFLGCNLLKKLVNSC